MAVEDSLDIFGSDPFGRDYLYGLSTGRDGQGLQPPPQGLQLDTRPYDQMQATPRGFTSGLFSDLLGGTLNMPSMPRTGIPALDLLYMNRNPVLNMMGVGDIQKTAERISYGQPLTTGSGMTTKPREETIGAALTVAPFIGNTARFGTKAGRAGARMVGERIAENVAMGRPNLPSMLAEPRSSLFAVEPSPSMAVDESSAVRQQLTGKMQALLAQKKVATSAVEVGAINQQIGELQAQFKSLPAVGRVAREVVAPQITAPVSDLGFYSAAEQAAMNLERSKGTGQSFLNDLMNAPDVKKDELSWIGLDDFLKDKPNVTKQEVQDFIASNKIDLQEVRLGEPFTEDPVGVSKRLAIFDKYEPEIQDLYRRIDKPEYVTYDEETNQVLKSYKNYEDALWDNLNPETAFGKSKTGLRPKENSRELKQKITDLQNIRDAEADAVYVVPEPAPTKHPRWQLAGGENYREILLKLPEKTRPVSLAEVNAERAKISDKLEPLTQTEYDALVQSGEVNQISIGGGKYQSSHFDEPNILAHIRVNDRIDADGKKMLLVEELQSDWHQAGRESGYKTGKERNPAQVEKELTITTQKRSRLLEEAAALPDSEMTKFKAMNEEIKKLSEQAAKLNEEWTNLLNKPEGVPDAPFKDTWYQLSLKRILKYAADNGYERVGLTTGKQQVDRFSNELRQNVDEINFNPIGTQNEIIINAKKNGQNTFSGTVKDGKFIDGQAQGKTVEEVLGKTMAKQIAEKQTGVLKGDNLTVGGEGMKAYYDEIYPKFLEKYGKKWDAGVGETKVRTNEVPYIDYVVTKTPFSDFTVVGVKPDGSKTIINQNANSIEEAQKLATRYKDKNLKSGEPIRYIDITPKMKEGVKKGQPLAAAEQTPEMLASGGLDYADPFKNPLLESSIG